ncbi:MAG: SGNH/GDSL hydrolase family protein [Rubripirellula sp.]
MAEVNRRGWLHGGAVVGMAAVSKSVGATQDGTDQAQQASPARGYDYQCPQLKRGSRLVFQGDSITDMKWGRNEKDRNHYLGHSYVYLVAARLGVDLPGQELQFFNRGMSGHKVLDLRKRWQKDSLDLKPDLISILVGVNDVGRNLKGVDVARWEEDYRFMLSESRDANPKLRIVLLDPFVLPSGRLQEHAAYLAWRRQVDRLIPIVERLAAEFDAVHVQTQMMFDGAANKVSPEHWIWDGVHPLPQGHELIAREWIRRVSERWPS